ncbi:MAG: Tfx family DNA-binding protein [Desulfurococcales archaeon]|nr:Tfx family DNA-binding protein [Desulfurococcales archaeon]
MGRRKYGLLTEKQYLVLKLRLQGLTQEEIAKMLNTTRENISIIERRARDNIRLAEETLNAYKELLAAGEVVIKPGTHLVEVPKLVISRADELGIKLRANFTMLYDEIRYGAGDCISGTRVEKPIKVLIFKDGSFDVVPIKQ